MLEHFKAASSTFRTLLLLSALFSYSHRVHHLYEIGSLGAAKGENCRVLKANNRPSFHFFLKGQSSKLGARKRSVVINLRVKLKVTQTALRVRERGKKFFIFEPFTSFKAFFRSFVFARLIEWEVARRRFLATFEVRLLGIRVKLGMILHIVFLGLLK